MGESEAETLHYLRVNNEVIGRNKRGRKSQKSCDEESRLVMEQFLAKVRDPKILNAEAQLELQTM